MAHPKRKAIDRRIAPCTPAAAAGAPGRLIEFKDEHGKIVQGFDPAQMAALPPDLARLLLDAFQEHSASRAEATRYATWVALRRFSRFVQDDGMITAARMLDTEAMGRYVLWLQRSPTPTGKPRAAYGAQATAFALLRPLLEWSKRNRPGQLPADLEVPYNPFPSKRAHQKPRRRVSQDQLKAILSACYQEIDAVWARFSYGQEIMRAPDLPPKILRGEGLARWIWRIARIENGLMPGSAALSRNGICPGTLIRYWGGQRLFTQYFHATLDGLVPFFLAIAIQTAANPEPLRLIKRDCLVPHPLDEHRTIIDWCKPKTGARLKRSQRRSFDRRRRYAAPNLIDKVLAMTAPLLDEAPPSERDRLFLARSVHLQHSRRRWRGRVAVIEHSALRRAIDRFVVRANHRIAAWNAQHPDAPQTPIEDFAPVFFRGSVATEHYRASGGDVLLAQSVLNHADAATTEAYIKGEETTRFQRQTIARLQGLMVTWIIGDANPDADPSSSLMGKASVPFGHDCLAPVTLSQDGSSARLCPRFGGCLACPGLVIPIDAPHLARILSAVDRLEAARERLDPRRWAILYGPTHRILTQDILPDFPVDMHRAARSLATSMPRLPELE